MPIQSSALHFIDTDELVNCGSGATIDDIFSGGGTLCAFIYAEGAGGGGYGRIIEKVTGYSFMVTSLSGGYLRLDFVHDFDSQPGEWYTTARPVPTNAWCHVAVTYNRDAAANDPTFYVDGQVFGATEYKTPANNAVSDAAATFRIGNVSATNRGFDGLFADVRAYSAILSVPQIQQIVAECGADGIVGNLQGRWKMRDGIIGEIAAGAGIIQDASGNGNHGTPAGDPLFAMGPLCWLQARFHHHYQLLARR